MRGDLIGWLGGRVWDTLHQDCIFDHSAPGSSNKWNVDWENNNDTLVAINIFETSCVSGFGAETANSGWLHEECVNINSRWMWCLLVLARYGWCQSYQTMAPNVIMILLWYNIYRKRALVISQRKCTKKIIASVGNVTLSWCAPGCHIAL